MGDIATGYRVAMNLGFCAVSLASGTRSKPTAVLNDGNPYAGA